MSWNPFKSRKSISKQSEDNNELEERVQAIAQIEQSMKRLQKDTKKFIESSSNLVKIEQRMVAELRNGARSIKGADELAEQAEKMIDVSYQTEESQQQRDVTIKSTLVQPLKGLNEKFSSVQSAAKRREQSQQNYLKYLAKREKLMKDQNISGKYEANEKYLERTKADFERRTKQLQEDLPKFYSESLNYFDPCFKALMQAELNHNEKGKLLHEDLAKDFELPIDMTPEEFNYELDKMFEDIKTLSIVKAT